MRLVAGSNPAARTTIMKNLIKTLQSFFYRLFNRKQYWEEVLWDYEYEWDEDDATDPFIYFDEIEPQPLPNNVIHAAQRFICKGEKK